MSHFPAIYLSVYLSIYVGRAILMDHLFIVGKRRYVLIEAAVSPDLHSALDICYVGIFISRTASCVV